MTSLDFMEMLCLPKAWKAIPEASSFAKGCLSLVVVVVVVAVGVSFLLVSD